MANEEYVVLLNVDTGESVKSIGDLKNNVKTLKKSLDQTDIGTKEYAKTLKELDVNQRALKLAMSSSEQSFEDLEKAANGASDSYNSLSSRMAEMKKEMKATNDVARRNELSAHINEINDRLKEMDAKNGVFSRNVGDYENKVASAFSRMSGSVQGVTDSFSGMGVAVGGLQTPLTALNGMFKILSANPFIAVIGVIVLGLQKVAKWMKTSEDNVNALNMALAPLTASTTAFKNIMQKLGEWLANVAQWLTDIAKKLHLFSDEMLESIKVEEQLTQREIDYAKKRREVEKQTADDMLEIAKLKSKAAEKDKYTAQERIKFIDEAIRLEEGIAKRRKELAEEDLRIQEGRAAQAGNSAEENDKLADAYVNVRNAEADYFNKKKDLSAQRVEAINAIRAETEALKAQQQAYSPTAEVPEEVVDEVDVEAENALLRQRLISDAEWSGIAERYEARKEEEAYLKEHYEEEKRMAEEATKAQSDIRKNSLLSIAGATADILGSISEMVGGEGEKQFKVQKGLQIAQATINTISGAIGAFTQASSTIPPPFGQIVGAAQAAAVTAAGVAQIAKIKNTKYTKGGSSSAPSAPSTPGVSVNPPHVEQSIPTIRRLTGASEEDRLNQMANGRVYILNSDLEAAANDRQAQVTETSF